jgi:hypothetical protein
MPRFILLVFLLVCTLTSMAQNYGNSSDNRRFWNKNAYRNKKYDYYIRPLNDSVIKVNARINIDDSIHVLKMGKGDKARIIKPSDTKEVYRYAWKKKITGTPHDTCWLFLTEDYYNNANKIRTYSVTSDIDLPKVAYIQKGRAGAMLPLTADNLRPMVADNKNALQMIEKDDLLNAIEIYNQY